MTRAPSRRNDSDDGHRAELSTWLAREMAAAAESSGADLSTPSAIREIAACAEMLSRLWPRAAADSALHGDGPSRVAHELVARESTPLDGSKPLQQLGRFEILRVLGHGGFGVVFLVFDPVLEREAALKVPRPEILVSPALRARFLREAQTAAVLDHAGIVPLFETGEVGPIGYLLSAYCRGPTLAGWRAEHAGPIAPRTAAYVVALLADALQHAHSRGVLHRDVKPSNVLLDPIEPRESAAEPGFAWTPRLSDFGLAKRLDDPQGDTRRGAPLGTPRYMAPEQAAGDDQAIGIATDVYGLGAVLHELLVGAPPLVGRDDNETLRRIQTEEVPSAPLRERQIPRDLERICLKCLAKDQAERYASARELADDLRRYRSGLPVAARPLNVAERMARWCRRRPVVAALAGGLLLAVALGVGAVAWQWRRAERHLIEAEQQAARAQAHLAQAESTLADLGWIVEESALWAPESTTFRDEVQTKLNQYLEQVTSQDETVGEPNPIVAAIYSFSARHAALSHNDKSAGRDNYRLAVDLWRQLVVAHPENASYRRGLSMCLLNLSLYECDWHRRGGQVDPVAATREFYRNIAADERFGDWSLYDYAQLVDERGNLLANARRPNEAAAVHECGLIAAEVLLESQPDEPEYHHLHGCLALHLAKEQRRSATRENVAVLLESAQASLSRAVQLRPNELPFRAELADAERMLGICARDRRDYPAAEALLTSAVAHLERVVAQNENLRWKLLLAATLRDLAYARTQLDRKHEALVLFGRCREIWHRAHPSGSLAPEDKKQFATACRDEGKLAQELGQMDIARAAFAVGVEVFASETASPRADRSRTIAHAECHLYLGKHQMAAGEREAAIASFQQVRSLLQPLADLPRPSLAVTELFRSAGKNLDQLLAEPM